MFSSVFCSYSDGYPSRYIYNLCARHYLKEKLWNRALAYEPCSSRAAKPDTVCIIAHMLTKNFHSGKGQPPYKFPWRANKYTNQVYIEQVGGCRQEHWWAQISHTKKKKKKCMPSMDCPCLTGRTLFPSLPQPNRLAPSQDPEIRAEIQLIRRNGWIFRWESIDIPAASFWGKVNSQ